MLQKEKLTPEKECSQLYEEKRKKKKKRGREGGRGSMVTDTMSVPAEFSPR